MSREAFLRQRDLLLSLRADHARAAKEHVRPALDRWNWALDHFDRVADPKRVALRIVHDEPGEGGAPFREEQLTFGELTARSNQLAALLHASGVARGDRVLVMMPNRVELWETLLACIKLGAVIVPATTQLVESDIEDRVARGGIRHVVTDVTGEAKVAAALEALGPPGARVGRFSASSGAPGFRSLGEARGLDGAFRPEGETRATDPLLLYFTSGTTAKPKLVMHTHESYPVGHLSTMYWIGLRPGDVHWNISSPGWAKHAWSNVFAPWNAEATVLVFDYARFVPKRALELLRHARVTSLCAPPTVWRMLILEDLAAARPELREIVAAGEPLNPEIIERVRQAWGITIRDGYGQTETTAMVGNTPGSRVVPGSMGRPLPGYRVVLLDADDQEADEGEIALALEPRPLGLMTGYADDPDLMARATQGGYYRTGDVATRDEDGYLTYVGRADDVFKASDYRISPFELESALLEHPAVAEAAVVPSPDPVRLAVPKAFVALTREAPATAETARAIFAFLRERLSPFKRVRRLEMVSPGAVADGDPPRIVAELPKTISGKIRRVELKRLEEKRRAEDRRGELEHWDEDFS
jgi:acetyl-CoA synthetase